MPLYSQNATLLRKVNIDNYVPFIVLIFGLLVPATTFGQLVCLNGECSCDDERAPLPNLSVSRPVHVTGTLVDDVGAPFVFENTIVQLRTAKNKVVIVTVSVDRQGRFDIGVVPAGQYRLIAARRWDNGKLSRQPLFDQPKPMTCSGESDCLITAVQHQHG